MTLLKLRSGGPPWSGDYFWLRLLTHGVSRARWLQICLSHILNNFWVIATSPKTYLTSNFQNLIGKRLLGDIMEIPQKYWHCKVFLCLKLTTITQLNSLFVLYCWSSSYCRCLIKLWNGPNSSITIKSLH